jgi:hypothetical protein
MPIVRVITGTDGTANPNNRRTIHPSEENSQQARAQSSAVIDTY